MKVGSNDKQLDTSHCFVKVYQKRDVHRTTLLHLPKLKAKLVTIDQVMSTAKSIWTEVFPDPEHETPGR